MSDIREELISRASFAKPILVFSEALTSFKMLKNLEIENGLQ